MFDDLIGVAWREGGRSVEEGLDCYGVVLVGLERLGLPMLDVWEQWRDRYLDGWRDYEEAVPNGWEWHSPGSAVLEGDVLVTRDRGIPRHLGLAVRIDGALRVLTAYDGAGVLHMPLEAATLNLEGIARRAET